MLLFLALGFVASDGVDELIHAEPVASRVVQSSPRDPFGQCATLYSIRLAV
jgi:hypothetical protein